MKITFNTGQDRNKIAFKSRNPEIRFADEVMRRVNCEFPMISPARLYDTFSKKSITPEQVQCLERISNKFGAVRRTIPDQMLKPQEYVQGVPEAVQKHKMGNCGEAGTLAKIGLAVNGIKGVKAGLYGYSTPKVATNLDYTLILVNLNKDADLSNYKTFGKKAYVVNQWGGFVGYVDEVFPKLITGYAKDKRMQLIKTFGIKIRDFDINDETLKTLKKKYPNLEIKKQKKFRKPAWLKKIILKCGL